MSKSAPLPGSEARLNPDLVRQRKRGGRMQPALFHARERRLERFVRAGVMLDDNVGLFPSGPISNPVTLDESRGTAILIARFEHFGVPNGRVLSTGNPAFRILFRILSGNLDFRLKSNSVLEFGVLEPLDVPDSGLHTYVIAVNPDPAGDLSLPLEGRLWLDGRLVFERTGATTGDPTISWASSTADWAYADTLTNVGQIDDLELYLGQLPALF